MAKTLIFVDLDNIYRGMLEYYGLEPTDEGYNLFEALRKMEEEKGNETVDIFVLQIFRELAISHIGLN